MGVFTTQFEMKKVLTHVTVKELEKNTFGCILNMADISNAANSTFESCDYDMIIKRIAPGEWETVGKPKTDLNEDDILSLGNAIEGDKTVELFGPENY